MAKHISNLLTNIEPYNAHTKDRLKEKLVNQVGHDGSFEDDVWVYKKHANYKVSRNSDFCIRFSIVPKSFKEVVKYFVLREILAPSSLEIRITSISQFLNYIIKEHNFHDLNELNYFTIERYRDVLAKSENTKNVIRDAWKNLKRFFELMSDFEEVPDIVFPNDPDYRMIEKRNSSLKDDNSKLTKENYLELDRVFLKYKDVIPLHVQTIYWILRLIPCRINEVLDMEIVKSLRKVNDEYKITIPVPKTSARMQITEKIVTLTGESEAEKFLIELIERQAQISLSLQKKVKEKNLTEGLLFTTLKTERNHTVILESLSYSTALVGRFARGDFQNWLNRIIKKADSIEDNGGNKVYNLRMGNNELCDITTHDFRHEGITSRIDYGFVTHKVMFYAGLITEGTTFGYYTPRTETVILSEPIYNPEGAKYIDENDILIKTSEIVVPEAFDEINRQISFQGNSNTDEILLKFQIDIERQSPIVTNEGLYLGNCPNFYDCSKIKKELKCIGCDKSLTEIADGGIGYIEKAIERYKSDLQFYKRAGNKRMENISETFLNKYLNLKKKYELKGVNYESK